MSELSPEAKRVLVQLRKLDEPTLDERSSGDAAVRRMLEAQGMHDMPALGPSAARPSLAARSGSTLKLAWGLGAAFIATLGWLGADAWRSEQKAAAPTTAQTAPAAPPSPSPQQVASAQPPVIPPQPAAAATPSPSPGPSSSQSAPPRKRHEAAEASLADELRFVSSVDADIRAGSYDRALRRLQQHKGTSLLQEERAAMRVLALCGRDHDSHAQREREQFLKTAPSSVLSARVRAACAGAPKP